MDITTIPRYTGQVTGSSEKSKSVRYHKPIIERTKLGTKPRNSFDQQKTGDGYVACQGQACTLEGHNVWRDVPLKNADGTPQMIDVDQTVDLTPRSPLKYGAVAGLAGAALGGLGGWLAAGPAGVAPAVAAGVGAAAVGGVSGAIAALAVHGDKVKLVWDTHEIIDRRMTGYQEFVGPGEKNGERGFFHRFIAEVPEEVIGTYQTPRAVHYKEGEEPEPAPAHEPKVAPEAPSPAPPADPVQSSWIPRFLARIFEPAPPPLDVTVTYEDESLQSRRLGSIPMDYWSYFGGFGGYTSCSGDGCEAGSRDIWRDTPLYEPDKEPRVDTRTERIQAQAYSVPLFGAGGLALGGAAGYGLGLLLAHATGLPPTLTAGITAGVAGVAAGLGAAGYAANDQVRLEWRENSIDEKKLVGYTEWVTPHYETRCRTTTDSDGKSSTECETVQNGWDHHFSPDIESWSVGSYVGPKVVHYQEKDGHWEPVAEPSPDPDPDAPPADAATQSVRFEQAGNSGQGLPDQAEPGAAGETKLSAA